MTKKITAKYVVLVACIVWLGACKVPAITGKQENKSVPAAYNNSQDSSNIVKMKWRQYFTDPNLIALIDTALINNQELNITLQEIEMTKNEIMQRKGEYMPFLNLKAGAAVDRAGKYTWDGLSEEDWKARPDKEHKYVGDFMVGTYFTWELDVWKKLRNAKKSAVMKYLSTIEGKNFMLTNIIAEIAESYYELMALDNLLTIVQQNIELQNNALQLVKLEKDAAKVTQLAVNRFEAQLLNTKNLQFEIQQKIVETENRINFLAGRFPQPVVRNSTAFNHLAFDPIFAGVPSQLLSYRPDIRQAELELAAAKLDVQVAKANFYPSFSLHAGVGLQAFNPVYLIRPESILYNLAGDMIAPLINRNAIKATYFNANAKQIQAVYNYERSILNAHIEVVNQLSRMDNFTKSFETKAKEVEILTKSIIISNDLFRSARADYIEVLLTQREALDSKIELIEIKLKQFNAKVNIYKSLGGGWN
ncbi:efflux transporter outer membrane subunit [Lacibacter luteus]|uniref:Efflux transporter outer membrane subunit n=1 Tax=Lacibacter luteus TaxID=2508719 RepID=A0A4Q1CF62_9BACT|nr:efflux transporter outer membrane subunit [Lacibacter luteus]RXK58419.1 efflux transporter outer membrane subunit [Lacibacter luteus]